MDLLRMKSQWPVVTPQKYMKDTNTDNEAY